MPERMDRRDFLAATGAVGAAAAVPVLGAGRRRAPDGQKTALALVGCAHIHTPGFVKLLAARPDVVVKYVWDHEESRASRWAAELESRAVHDPGVIWNDPEVSGVVVCSETNRHYPLVMAAAKAGKHMFVEKPLGIKGGESLEMAEAIERAGSLFTTGYFHRSSPVSLFLKEEIRQGHFGKISRVRSSSCHDGSLGKWFDDEWRWMADPKIAGFGGFGDLGIHSLDILLWLVGEVESVTADIKVVTGNYGDCDESGEALLRFENGATGTLAAGWVDIADPVSLLISGTEGHAVVVNDRLYYTSGCVEGAEGKAPWVRLPAGYAVPLDLFIDSVAGVKGLPLVSAREAALRVVVMEAMYRSSRERKWITIPDVSLGKS